MSSLVVLYVYDPVAAGDPFVVHVHISDGDDSIIFAVHNVVKTACNRCVRAHYFHDQFNLMIYVPTQQLATVRSFEKNNPAKNQNAVHSVANKAIDDVL